MLRLLAPYQLRLVCRGAFGLLAIATLMTAVYVIWQEKDVSYFSYRTGFAKTAAEISARLHHPAGQLALINPTASGAVTPLHPLILPFAGIDFDDRNKVQQAVDMSGCEVQYKAGTVCVAIGNSPFAGGFIYVAGSFSGSALVAHHVGTDDVPSAHRILVSVDLRGQSFRWVAPFESMGDPHFGLHGRLTGYVDSGPFAEPRNPVKDFRGWIWQSPRCDDVRRDDPGCPRRAFFSLRLPTDLLHDDLLAGTQPRWPPPDLAQILVHVKVLPPNTSLPLLDSDSADAQPPFRLTDLTPLLLPGETLGIRKKGSADWLRLRGTGSPQQGHARLINAFIRLLPVEGEDKPIRIEEPVSTPMGAYEVALDGDLGSVNRGLSVVVGRVMWFVVVLLVGLLLTWLVIEIGIIRRITELTRRAASVSRTITSAEGVAQLDLNDLRGPNEIGVLAQCLADLLRRVQEDVQREHIRAEQEKDRWHAVGHEIMSPLQSLLALHDRSEDNSVRYLLRMQQALRILYGTASPSEAFQAGSLQLSPVDIDDFLQKVADNAPCVGIADVTFASGQAPIWVRADEYALEDVVTHVLRNAERYRPAGTAIQLGIAISGSSVVLTVYNQGPCIPVDMLDRIFEYGVSDQPGAGASASRGQGLFVARTYMAKMGGTIIARNENDGVTFVMTLPLAA